jgi:predicted nucleic acid-binding protein
VGLTEVATSRPEPPLLLDTSAVLALIGDEAGADRCIALPKQLAVTIVWGMDEATMLTAARIKAQHRVSLADALIAAFAVRAGGRRGRPAPTPPRR